VAIIVAWAMLKKRENSSKKCIICFFKSM